MKILGLPVSYTLIQYVLPMDKDYMMVLVLSLFGTVMFQGTLDVLNAFVVDTIPDRNKMGEIGFFGPIGQLVGASYGPVAAYVGWGYSVLINIGSLGGLALFIAITRPFT